MVNTALVSTGIGVIKQCSTKDQAKYNKFNIATGQNSCSSLSRKTDALHNKIQHYGGLNVSDTTNSILVASLRESTRKKYNPYQQKWHTYCQENNINPVTPNITNVLDFLSNLYDQGLSYSAINSAKSALLHIILIPPRTQNYLTTLLCHNMGKLYLIKDLLDQNYNLYGMLKLFSVI